MPSQSFRSSGTSVARAAGRLDLVVEFFEPADGARDRHDMRAGLRELQARSAAPMPREAPVTSAMRSARGFVMRRTLARKA